MLDEMRKIDECDTEKFGTLDSSAKTIVVPGDRWWLHTTKQEGDKISQKVSMQYVEKNVMRAQML